MFQYWPIVFGLKTAFGAGRRMVESGRNWLGLGDAPAPSTGGIGDAAGGLVSGVTGFTYQALDLVGAMLDPSAWIEHVLDGVLGYVTGIGGGLVALFAGWKALNWLLGERRTGHVRGAGSYIAYAVPAAQLPQIQASLAKSGIVFQPGPQTPGAMEQLLMVAAYHKGVFERLLNRSRVPYRIAV